MLSSGGFDDGLILWSIKEQKIIKSFSRAEKPGGIVFDVNWSHDGKMLAAGNNKSVVILDIRYMRDQY
jgi:WD40 repeat protein